jgi:STAS-like domain of unknown function (DUF4325)
MFIGRLIQTMTAANEITITIANDFSKSPGPRLKVEGAFSGEKFREEILTPKVAEALRDSKVLLIDLDGTAGYGTSFLEEAFGGLIRHDMYSYEDLKKILRFKSQEEPYLIEEVWKDIGDACGQE